MVYTPIINSYPWIISDDVVEFTGVLDNVEQAVSVTAVCSVSVMIEVAVIGVTTDRCFLTQLDHSAWLGDGSAQGSLNTVGNCDSHHSGSVVQRVLATPSSVTVVPIVNIVIGRG